MSSEVEDYRRLLRNLSTEESVEELLEFLSRYSIQNSYIPEVVMKFDNIKLLNYYQRRGKKIRTNIVGNNLAWVLFSQGQTEYISRIDINKFKYTMHSLSVRAIKRILPCLQDSDLIKHIPRHKLRKLYNFIVENNMEFDPQTLLKKCSVESLSISSKYSYLLEEKLKYMSDNTLLRVALRDRNFKMFSQLAADRIQQDFIDDIEVICDMEVLI